MGASTWASTVQRAVNFAPAGWFRFESAGTKRFRTFKKPSVVSHEGLLLKVAETDDSPETCFWAKQDLQRVIAEERQWRCKLWSTGSDIHRTSSYLGVTPVALTNADATAMRPLRAPLSQALAWLGPHPPPATYLQHLLLAASQKLPKHLSRRHSNFAAEYHGQSAGGSQAGHT
ncbi:TPA: hypothetical protein ACH3X1_006338 [Trebouxia sp. C0004]